MFGMSAGKFRRNCATVLETFLSGVHVACRGQNFGERLGDLVGEMLG